MSKDKKPTSAKPRTVTRGRTPITVVQVAPTRKPKESAGITPIPRRVVPTNKKKT
jgi:hypothetical protein